jgi:invasion protein IalB
MLVRIFNASKIEGAPSNAVLHNLTKKPIPPSFLRDTPEGWRVETDDPEWEAYLTKASGKMYSHQMRYSGTAGVSTAKDKSDLSLAVSERMIQQALNERIKAESAMIDLEVKKGKYIKVESMRYLFSYFQRCITDGCERIKHTRPDNDQLEYVCNELKHDIDTMVIRLEQELATFHEV